MTTQDKRKETEERKEGPMEEAAVQAKKEAAEAKSSEAKSEASSEKKEEKAKDKTKELSKKGEEILKSIGELTVIELANLVSALEDKFGIQAQATVAVAAAGPGAAGGGAAEEQTSFTVVLSKVGANKIQVIKVIREVTSLGLKEAKDLVEAAPKPVREDVSKEESATIKKKLEEAGASVELK